MGSLVGWQIQEEHVGNGLRTQARRVLLRQVAPTYYCSSASRKQQILEDFVGATGYARTYAQWLLNHAEEVCKTPTDLRQRYGPEVEQALVLAWKTLNRICAKRLIPFLPSIVATLEQHGHLHLSEEHRSLLLSMSSATADRLLQAHRYSLPRGRSTTKAGTLLKEQIPIRTFGKSERGPARLLGGRSGRPLWRTLRGRLSLYTHTNRCCHWLDRMPSPAQPWERGSAGCSPASQSAPPVSYPGSRYR
jgi:hypothetical protein